eukprot:6177152-Pleurochrysis_carterae.AAC.4
MASRTVHVVKFQSSGGSSLPLAIWLAVSRPPPSVAVQCRVRSMHVLLMRETPTSYAEPWSFVHDQLLSHLAIAHEAPTVLGRSSSGLILACAAMRGCDTTHVPLTPQLCST